MAVTKPVGDPGATTRKFRIVQPEGGREVAKRDAHDD
jgi:hypothetical protein